MLGEDDFARGLAELGADVRAGKECADHEGKFLRAVDDTDGVGIAKEFDRFGEVLGVRADDHGFAQSGHFHRIGPAHGNE